MFLSPYDMILGPFAQIACLAEKLKICALIRAASGQRNDMVNMQAGLSSAVRASTFLKRVKRSNIGDRNPAFGRHLFGSSVGLASLPLCARLFGVGFPPSLITIPDPLRIDTFPLASRSNAPAYFPFKPLLTAFRRNYERAWLNTPRRIRPWNFGASLKSLSSGLADRMAIKALPICNMPFGDVAILAWFAGKVAGKPAPSGLFSGDHIHVSFLASIGAPCQ